MRVSLLAPRRAHSAEAGAGGARMAQAGETLLEVMFSIMLMTIAFSAILGGMITSSRVAKINQEKTRASVALQAYSELILQPIGLPATNYKNCATTPESVVSYFGVYAPSPPTGTLPAGWRVRVSKVVYLGNPHWSALAGGVKEPNFISGGSVYDQDAAAIACYNSPGMQQTPPTDGGLQAITIVVEKNTPGGYQLLDSVVVTKRDQRCPTNIDNADQGPC